MAILTSSETVVKRQDTVFHKPDLGLGLGNGNSGRGLGRGRSRGRGLGRGGILGGGRPVE